MKLYTPIIFALIAVSVGCSDAPSPVTAPHAAEPARSLTASIEAVTAPAVTIFGPERFTRTTQAPVTTIRTIATDGFKAPFVLHVRSGARDGTGRVSSGSVSLDEQTLLSPRDFSARAAEWQFTVSPSETATLAVTLAGSPGSFIDVWLDGARAALRVCPSGSPTTGTFTTLAAAVAAADPGSTILLCDGTHLVQDVTLGLESLTIEAEGPGIPTLDAGGAPVNFSIGAPFPTPSTASVTLRKLRLQNAAHDNVSVAGNYGQVVIDHVEFHPSSGPPTSPFAFGYNSGINVSSGGASGVTVQNSAFVGGDIGVFQNAGHVVATGNTFTLPRNAAVFSAGGGVADVENNTVNGCGTQWCMFFVGGTTTVAMNHIVVDISHPTTNAIQVNASAARILSNTISGSGGARDPLLSQSWPMYGGILAIDGGAVVDVSGNTVSDAFVALGFNNVTGVAHDNVVSASANGVDFIQTDVAMTRSDFRGYTTPIRTLFASPAASGRCNWWGASTGPVNMPPWPSDVYTPFATQPIANQPAVTCGP